MTDKSEGTNLAKRNINSIEDFIKKIDTGQNFLLGLSGGIDSTTLGYLISQRFEKKRFDSFTFVNDWLDKNATDFAIDIGKKISNRHETILLSKIYNQKLLKDASPEDYSILLGHGISYINNLHINTHQSMISAHVQETAVHLGHFGTYQGEVSPLAHFFKSEIYSIANELQVPQETIDRVPGSGILDTMTDEELMGVPYEKLEKYLLNVRVKDDGSKAFALEYLAKDREGIRALCKLTKKQLEHLEYRLLNSARFWIREGPRPKREERHVVTEKINYNFLTGELFRPTSYTISPAGEEETPREIYRRKYDKIIEKIGIVPINDNIFQIDEKRENAIKRDYRLREDSIKEIVLLRKKDKIKIAQHTPEGIKILTVTRGDFKRPKTGC